MSNLKKLRDFKTKNSLNGNLEFGAVASALQKSGGIKSKAQRMLNCSTKTLNDYIKENPDLNEIIREAKQYGVGVAHEKLLEGVMDGKPWAIKLYLTTIGKEEFSTRQEITGADGAPAFEFNKEDAKRMMSELIKEPKKNEDNK